MPDETATLEAPVTTQAAGLEVPDEGTPTEPVAPETPEGGEKQEPEEQRYEVSDEERGTPLAQALKAESFREAQSQFEKTRQKHADELTAKLQEDHEYAISQLQTRAAQERSQAVEQAVAQAGLQAVSSAIAEAFGSEEEAEAALDKVLSNPKYAAWANLRSGAVWEEGQKRGRSNGITQASTLAYHGLNAEQTRELERFVVVNLQPKLAEGELTVEQAFQQQLAKRDAIMRADVEAKLEKLAAERQEIETKAKGREEKAPPATNFAGRSGAGGTSYRTKTEAATLHVQGKLSNEQMRRINADPSIPD